MMTKLSAVLIPVVAALPTVFGDERAAPDDAAVVLPTPREIYVPWDDVNVLLHSQPQRIMMTRGEFEQLWAEAHRAAAQRPPRSASITSAEYRVQADYGRARIRGQLTVEILEPGLHAVPLVLGGAGLSSARLDGGSAALGAADDGRLMLFVEGRGRHDLELDLVTHIETTAAEQKLHFEVPMPAATRLHLQAPGDVELKGGAQAIRRVVDRAGNSTQFELLPGRGPLSIVLSLNSRLKREQRVVIARSVVVDEITAGYERVHASFSMDILHKAVERFRFNVPNGFEITEVQAATLASWAMDHADGRPVLEVRLREPTTERVGLTISALRSAAPDADWQFPDISALDTQGQVAVLGVVVDERLRPRDLRHEGLIPIDVAVLSKALPSTLTRARAGAPAVRAVAAFYAPQTPYRLGAVFDRPQPGLAVTTNTLLTLSDSGHALKGGFRLLPDIEKLFEFDFTLPAEWQVTRVTLENGRPLHIERHAAADGRTRARVALPDGMPPGQPGNVYFHATHSPSGWLDDWRTRTVTFPFIAVLRATRQTGAVAVTTVDDFTVRPEALAQLTPLDEDDKQNYGLTGVETDLAYRFDALPYEATLRVERIAPRLTAQSYSFLALGPEMVSAHYEVAFEVEEARTRTLELILPASTPEALSIHGLDGVVVKEFSGAVRDGNRHWTVLLETNRQGPVRLAMDFEQALENPEPIGLALPVVQAGGVAYQSGLVAVEGSAELDVTVHTDLGRADIGQLADAEYQPGARLLGAYTFIERQPVVSVDIARPAVYGLPAVIVQRAELVTLLSAHGVSQSAARFHLRTKLPFLEVQLPAQSTLWSVELDGTPVKPQRESGKLLLSLPAAAEATLRDLRVVYETPIGTPGLSGQIEVPAPQLMLRGAGQAVPMADLLWHLNVPWGYHVVDTGGTVETNELRDPPLGLTQMGAWLYELVGGVNLFYSTSLARSRGVSGVLLREAAGPAGAFRGGEGGGGRLGAPDGAVARNLRGFQENAPAVDETKGDRRSATEKLGDELRVDQPVVDEQPMAAVPSSRIAMPWAMEGVRSLKIDLQGGGRQLTFRSLAEAPSVSIGLSHTRRLGAFGWGLALAVGLVGVWLWSQPVRIQWRVLLGIAAAATVLPAVTGSANLTTVLNPAFFAAVALTTLLLVVACSRRVTKRWRPRASMGAPVAAAIAIALVCLVPPRASAEDPENADAAALIALLQPSTPIHVPADAIILPYDPDMGVTSAGELLVPYETYLELQRRVNPQSTDDMRPPAPFAMAGSRFTAALSNADSLLVYGVLEIDVFTDDPVAVPLPLEGSVLARADLDGAAAQLSVARPQPRRADATRQAAGSDIDEAGVVLLHIRGSGRHVLDFEMRLRVERRGGWRVTRGVLPTAPAAALVLSVPVAHTEVRLPNGAYRHNHTTAHPDERIETALGRSGELDLRWRPRITAGQIDRSLTAQSNAALDVQEDGVRLSWRLDLQFRGGERDAFTIEVPGDYHVTRVDGGNVRGWSVAAGPVSRPLEVALLKPAMNHEQLVIELWRPGAVTTLEAPVVTVDGAAMHHGTLTVRRSPLLELRSHEVHGLSRVDESGDAGVGSARPSPLGIATFRSYRFAATPYRLHLSVAPIRARRSAEVQAILRLAERQRHLEARFVYHIEARPTFELEALLPADLDIDHVSAPGAFEWDVTAEEDGQRLRVYLASGMVGHVPVIVRGTLGAVQAVESVSLPHLAAMGVERQRGMIVVQADPMVDVRPSNLRGCDWVPNVVTARWLSVNQRQLARLVVNYPAPGYGGTLELVPRAAVVSCDVISNVRVTDRVIEETVLIDFDIQSAGIRRVTFLLPGRMADAHIDVPLLRSKSIEAVPDDDRGLVRVTLGLQDAVTGELRVLVRNDHALGSDLQFAAVPEIETGHTQQRTVVFENAGRRELIIEGHDGFEALSRQQQAWRALAAVLGTQPTQAYVAGSQADRATLSYRVKDRAAVQTSGARIGLAEAWLAVDASGAYRGVQSYRVDNATAQFLTVELPAGSSLWTARVAGEVVKPVVGGAGATANQLRIPLVKTAAGDLDYVVRLTYAGKLHEPGAAGRTDFPLIRATNINVELSQVRLMLPESHRWFSFDGSMRQVKEEGDLVAGYLSYQTKQAQRLTETLQTAEEFSQVRAGASLKQLEVELGRYEDAAGMYAGNDAFGANLVQNSAVLKGAKSKYEELERDLREKESGDNRYALDQHFERQAVSRARDIVDELGNNFGDVGGAKQPNNEFATTFDSQWFDANDLANAALITADDAEGDGDGVVNGKVQDGLRSLHGLQVKAQALDDLASPQVAQEIELREHNKKARKRRVPQRRRGRDDKDTVARYKANLEAQTPVQEPMESSVLIIRQMSEDSQVQLGVIPQGGAQMAGGFASLDVEIPRRGTVYMFTTPRGDARVSARALTRRSMGAMTRVAIVVLVAVLGWALWHISRLAVASHDFMRRAATLTLLAGVLSMATGVLPLAGLLLVAVGAIGRRHALRVERQQWMTLAEA